MRRSLRWLLVLVVVVVVIVVLRMTVFRPTPIEVEVITASPGLVEDTVTNSQAGTVRSRFRSRLGAERSGRVVRIPSREGTVVASGDLLVLLDTSTAQRKLELSKRDLDVAEASAEAAKAVLAYQETEYERTIDLSGRGVVSQETMDQVKSRYDGARADEMAAQARLASARANVHLAQNDLDHMRVLAPFDGVIAARLVEVGESVIPGQPVIEIVDPDSLYVSAGIDEIDIGRVRERLPARVTLDPYRGEVWMGEVSRVYPVVDDQQEQNRVLQVEVEIQRDPSKPRPRPGTSADVTIIVDKRHDVLRVPTIAVLEGRRVLVAQDGEAVERQVTIGLRNWDWTEVQGGLQEGEQVITSLDRQGVQKGAHVAVTVGDSTSAVTALGAGP
jgi:HlyD family secretion protein